MWITRRTTGPQPDVDNPAVVERGGVALAVNSARADLAVDIDAVRTAYLFGELFYELREGLAVPFGEDRGARIAALLASGVGTFMRSVEGQFVGALLDRESATVTLFSDRYARLDLFCAGTGDGGFVAATDLDAVFETVTPDRDPLMFAHMLTVFGWYAPKGWTLYSNVSRLKIGEALVVHADGERSEEAVPFEPVHVDDLGDEGLERYFEALADSVRHRAASAGPTWVSASSGWDSTMLVAMLEHLDPGSARMVTGVMRYSDRTDALNRFEVDKIGRIGEYFGIKPEFVEFDFRDPSSADYWFRVLPYYRSRHVYSWTTFNFSRLNDALLGIAGRGQVLFNGETSDSMHNFGFSQFGTLFHTDKGFAEYADKMNCYLWGPTFLGKVVEGTYAKDAVWQIMTRAHPTTRFVSEWPDRAAMLEAYLLPMFHGSVRVPFADALGPVLTDAGRQGVRALPYRTVAPYALDSLTPETAYSLYVHLYHSFHSQGGTVNSMKHAAERSGNAWRSPFNDLRLVGILGRAPESWGRGLDFNRTKRPLKWVAREKIRFPYGVLEEGPHSYVYDVVEGFSLVAEVAYRSGVAGMLKECVGSRSYREVLDDSLVDVGYLDRLVDGYLAGRETSGRELSDLFSLAVVCATGWY